MDQLRLEWYGRIVNALFHVNKELSELAAAFIFRVSPSRVAEWKRDLG